MSIYQPAELLNLWKNETLTQEQAIGQLIQHLVLLTKMLAEYEKRFRQLEQQLKVEREGA